MAKGDNFLEIENFATESSEEIEDNVRSFRRTEFVGMPSDQQRAALYNMLAALIESGFSFPQSVEFVKTEASASRMKILICVGDFFEKIVLLPQEDKQAYFDQGDLIYERAFGKGMVFGEELVVLRAMVNAVNPVPLLKLAASFALDATKRQANASLVVKRSAS